MRPKLPMEIEQQLPEDIVPHLPKEKKMSVSPQLQKDIKRIQTQELRGISNMYLRDFDDFVLH